MITNWTADSLNAFEKKMAEIYSEGTIRAPIHLRSGCEEQLIQIFKNISPQDYIFNYWASHLHCLLKGVPEGELETAIRQGRSISLCFPDQKIYCSGIVGSLAGVAVGTALGLKMRQQSDSHVWLFTGDMGAETGIFHEAVKYATNFDLPITFVVEDNGISVMTDTRSTWGHQEPWFKDTRFEKKIVYYKYQNDWPHSGLGKRIAF